VSEYLARTFSFFDQRSEMLSSMLKLALLSHHSTPEARLVPVIQSADSCWHSAFASFRKEHPQAFRKLYEDSVNKGVEPNADLLPLVERKRRYVLVEY
jgi:hypothetical protein